MTMEYVCKLWGLDSGTHWISEWLGQRWSTKVAQFLWSCDLIWCSFLCVFLVSFLTTGWYCSCFFFLYFVCCYLSSWPSPTTGEQAKDKVANLFYHPRCTRKKDDKFVACKQFAAAKTERGWRSQLRGMSWGGGFRGAEWIVDKRAMSQERKSRGTKSGWLGNRNRVKEPTVSKKSTYQWRVSQPSW